MNLSFIDSLTGYYLVALAAGAIVLFWDWRVGVAGLLLVQWGMATLLNQVYGVPPLWALAQLLTTLIACTVLALTAVQLRWHRQFARSGVWLFRLLALGMVGFVMRTHQLRLPLPVLDDPSLALFTWLAAVALLTLGLSDSPLHTALGLTLWLIPVQGLAAILLPIPALVGLLASLELLLVLACSYLSLCAGGALLVRRPWLGESGVVAPPAPTRTAGWALPREARSFMARLPLPGGPR